ncbi:MAG TPA: hypothetical protein VNT81_22805 [Vicinamibacterales bacterium]|nr:hypothetical protein [Vicinamibacterales bacterium]
MSNDTSASEARAARLLTESAAIVERSLVYMPGDAFWEQRYAERARRFAHEDGAFHVRYLADAVRASSPTVMAEYARWLRDLLVPRGMCTLHLAEHLEHVGSAVVDCLGEGQESSYIQGAVDALRYDASAPRAIQEAAPALDDHLKAVTPRLAARHSAFETRYLCHYAADALQRGTPALLASHVEWSRSVRAASGIDSVEHEAWLIAVRDALQPAGLPPAYLQ